MNNSGEQRAESEEHRAKSRERRSYAAMFCCVLSLCFILLSALSSPLYAYRAKMFNSLTGGGTYAIDAVSVSLLQDGDQAFVADTGTSRWYHFVYVAAATDAENVATHPYKIRPDDYVTAGVWYETGVGYLVDGASGGSVYAGTGNFGALTAPVFTLGTGSGESVYIITLNLANAQIQDAEIDWSGTTTEKLAGVTEFVQRTLNQLEALNTVSPYLTGVTEAVQAALNQFKALNAVSPYLTGVTGSVQAQLNEALGTNDNPTFSGVTVGGTALKASTAGVTLTQTNANLPLKEISQGTAAGVIFKAWYTSTGVTQMAIMQNGDIIWCKDDGSVGTYWDASAGTIGIGISAAAEELTLKFGKQIGWTHNTGNDGVYYKIGKSTDGAGAIEFIAAITDGDYDAFRFSGGSSGTNALLSVRNVGGIGIGGPASYLNGTTAHVVIRSGVSPTGALANSAGLYTYENNLWGVSSNGDHTQLSSHDPETGEFYHHSYNSFTGQGRKYYPESGVLKTYTVPKVNPEEEGRKAWVRDYIAQTWNVEVPPALALDEVDNEVVVSTPKQSYVIKDGSVVKATVMQTSKIIQGRKKVLRADCRLDADTGKIYRRASQAEAEAAAVAGFKFDWATMPPFVREAWGK